MEDLILDIVARLKAGEKLDARRLETVIRRHNAAAEQAKSQVHRSKSTKDSPGNSGSAGSNKNNACIVNDASNQDSESKGYAEGSNTSNSAGELGHTSKLSPTGGRHFAKKMLLPFYLRVKQEEPKRWAAWDISPEIEAALFELLRIKPRRTASGVATVTVITKPWACQGECLYCPNDVRMPKSYLHDEPACQRAERNYFDPYLQATARLRTLAQMGHVTDKVELIILGGTWDDHPENYRIWFVRELFRALNDFSTFATHSEAQRRAFYHDAGIECDAEALAARARQTQLRVNAGELTHAQAMRALYASDTAWQFVSSLQTATMTELFAEQARNEHAAHRNVGLVIETRPGSITCQSLSLMRAMGCTKVQMGVQSLNARVLKASHRGSTAQQAAQALSLCRLFGFKTHVHFMANLPGATPEADAADYRALVTDSRFLPDEVKLYPCALIDGTGLMARYRSGTWQPYSDEELVNLLAEDVLVTPSFTRISRMIRDFSAGDIVCGNKRVNLRETVEKRAEQLAAARDIPIREIRHRELAGSSTNPTNLQLEDLSYDTTETREHFLQWITPEGRIAGFLRLSLPKRSAMERLAAECLKSRSTFPLAPSQAMIREVHVYGKVAALHASGQNAQHQGLGRALVERACDIARTAGYTSVNVISAVGTREYYRRLGFSDAGLYQRREL